MAEFNGKPAELVERDRRLAAVDAGHLLFLTVLELKQRERNELERRLQRCQERARR